MLRPQGRSERLGLDGAHHLAGEAGAQVEHLVADARPVEDVERVQKPNAFYILNRSSIGYEVLDLRTSFTREVVRTVQSEPF